MKNTWLSKPLGIGLLIAATILPGYGQMTRRTSVVAVNIPFDFVVANRTLPSGQYVLSPIFERALRVQGANGANYAIALIAMAVSGGKSDNFGHVVFNCYFDRCFLSQVWAARSEIGQELLPSPSSKKLAERHTGHYVAVLSGRLPYQGN
jgi:hypothetical protein